MATVTEMRAWLRANTSEDVPARGRLAPNLVRMYEDANGTPAEDDSDWDLPGGDDALTIDPEELEPSVPLQPERAPRTASAARRERRAQPVGERTGRIIRSLRTNPGAAQGKKKKPPPRQSVEKFTSRAYKQLGRMISTLSQPTGRCLQAQAAMAGVMLEDMVKNTVVDRILQPAVRAEDKLDKGFALIAPPICVFGIEMATNQLQQGVISQQQGMMRLAMLQSVLRESLYRGLELSEQYAEQIATRLAEDAQRDAEVDGIMAFIFGEPQEQPAEQAA